MKEILICPVCKKCLYRDAHRFFCEKGHSFDVAKQGYVNLLRGKGKTHGDNAMMIAARHRFLEKGFYAPLADALESLLCRFLTKDATVLDIGCGEGYYTHRAMQAAEKASGTVYAFDVSKDALKVASRRHAAHCLFVGSAYDMPIADQSIDLSLLFFSPFCREEILRVLKKDGLFLMAYPGEKHLWGLKQALYETPYPNKPTAPEIEGFTVCEAREISGEILLSCQEDIAALFAMTPYYYKTSAQDKEKLYALSSLSTEISFHLVLYQKKL